MRKQLVITVLIAICVGVAAGLWYRAQKEDISGSYSCTEYNGVRLELVLDDGEAVLRSYLDDRLQETRSFLYRQDRDSVRFSAEGKMVEGTWEQDKITVPNGDFVLEFKRVTQ